MRKPYRRSVGIMLINDHNQVFIGQRVDCPDSEAWQMPQGGIDRLEAPHQAAVRELMEETGLRDISKVEIIGSTEEWLSYEFPPDLEKRLWNGKYSGQQQKWFLIRFLGTDKDLDLTRTHPREFRTWRWAFMDEVEDLIVPFKRGVYKKVIQQFKKLL